MSRLRIPFAVMVAAAVAVSLGGHAAASAGSTTMRTVNVKDDAFSPKRAIVKRNTLVTFRWQGNRPHDVVSRGTRRFKSSTIKTRGTHRVRFRTRGTYTYVCTLHAGRGMTGRITVR
ncbi:MAG: cupredoxin domain-containing protein [Solirubrobacteraceae bacterium]|nr:cupredoxin domain-containing protein [Solirubrobacteraceae bacterium]